MITLCTVSHDTLEHEGVMAIFFFDSMRQLTRISEVVVAKPDAEKIALETWEEGGIAFKKLYLPKQVYPFHNTAGSVEHALALHCAIDLASNPWLLISDPDVFFFTDVASFYQDLMNDHGLNIVGISHQDAISSAARFFPCVTNMMVRKNELPGPDFLKGSLKIQDGFFRGKVENTVPADSMYLLPGPLEGDFPNPTGSFDTGCDLWLWAKENNWK